ncbi:MAG: hypothetical protein J5598_03095 [Clostridia bacterium]|nr:hypothetical protein [Clostridia bacterium]
MMMYEARANMAVVTMIDGLKQVVVPDCQILGQGTAPESTGIIIADGTRFWYIPLVTKDLKTAITKLGDLCDKVKAITDTLVSNAGNLVDNSSTCTGAAAFVPSVITGTQIKMDATSVQTEAQALKTEIDQLANSLA